jgi:nucleoside-triphosphatase THEP1
MIFLLTGPVHSGKTTLLREAVQKLKGENLNVHGFLSEIILKNDKIIGYDLFDLKEEIAIPFIRREGEKDWEQIGSFYLIPKSLAEASKIILYSRDADLLVVDEVGPLELGGKGLWPALEQVIFQLRAQCLLVARTSILEDFLKILGKREVKVFDVRDKDILPQILEGIKKSV